MPYVLVHSMSQHESLVLISRLVTKADLMFTYWKYISGAPGDPSQGVKMINQNVWH